LTVKMLEIDGVKLWIYKDNVKIKK
jgi:hypothetical protein